MMKLKKGFASIVIALIAVAILTAGVVALTSDPAQAYAIDNLSDGQYALLDSTEHFIISADGVLSGLSEEGEAVKASNELYAVKIPQGVKSIAPFAFKDDSQLAKVVVGTSVEAIGDYAFYGCSHLMQLEFEGEVVSHISDSTTTAADSPSISLGQKSFVQCTNLGVIHFPKRLSSIGYAAFADCSSVGFVYVPEGVTFESKVEIEGDPDTDDSGTLLYFWFNTCIVFENASAYSVANSANHPLQGANLNKTYPVHIDFQFGDTTHQTVTRLFGYAFNYVCDDNGIWDVDTSVTSLPKQEGFKTTVWYDSQNNIVGLSGVNNRLSAAGVSDFELHAIPSPVPTFNQVKDFTYDGKSYSFDTQLNQILRGVWSDDYNDVADMARYVVKRAERNGSAVDALCNAGTYKLYLNLRNPELYGEWEKDVEVTIEVAKLQIDLTQYENLHWWVADYHVSFASGTVYEYSYTDAGVNKMYYSVVELSSAPNPDWTNWTNTGNRKTVSGGVVNHRGTDKITVEITGKYPDAFNAKYTNNVQTELGKHTSTAELTPSENCEFMLPSGVTYKNEERGIQITFSRIQQKATITKEWYVVANDKALLNEQKSIEAGKEVVYEIPSWTFGDNISNETLARPRLQHDYESTRGYGYTFDVTLTKDGVTTTICVSEMSERWNYYINKYMPSGYYVITVHVGTKSLGPHSHWWNDDDIHDSGDVAYEFKEFTCLLYFQVYDGTLQLLDGYDSTVSGGIVLAGGDAGEVNLADLKANGYDDFFAYVGGGFTGGVNMAGIGVTGFYSYNVIRNSGTHWANVASEFFDDEPVKRYNLSRMHNNTYLKADDPLWNDYINTPGDYIVYYMASMRNYKNVPELNGDRYERYYTISVYSYVNAPTLDRTTFTYTGRVLTVNFTSFTPLEAYRYIISNNSQIDVGDYYAHFTLEDTKHYRWVTMDSTGKPYNFDQNGDLLLPFEIQKQSVAVPILPEAYYTGEPYFLEIPILTDFDDNDIYEVEYGRRYEQLFFTEVGPHPIVLTLRDTDNYKWASGDDDEDGVIELIFEILRAGNLWVVDPYVVEWEYNAYNSWVNLITAIPMDGEVKFYITDSINAVVPLPGLEEFMLEGGIVPDSVAEELNSLSAGTYYLWSSVDATTNYSSIYPDYVRFDVHPLVNKWVELPNIVRWVWNSFDADYNVVTAQALRGEARFVVLKDGVTVTREFSSSQEVAVALSGLHTGQYVLRAYVTADRNGNYTAIQPTDTTFNVLQATNNWDESPNIINWMQGMFDSSINVITSVPTYGSVVYSVLYNGAEVEGLEHFTQMEASTSAITDKLAALPVGSYELIAYVDGTDDYTQLDTIIRFNVLQVNNFWVSTPRIVRWTWGGYHSGRNTISAEPAFGDAEDIVFSIWRDGRAVQGLTEFKISDIEGNLDMVLGGLDAGEYSLYAQLNVPGYTTLSAEVPFDILIATNYWIKTPNIAPWIAVVETSSSPTGEARYGMPCFYIYTLNSDGTEGELVYDSVNMIDELAYIPSGWYKMVAHVDADPMGNYTGLDESVLEFRVFEPDTEVFNIAKTNAIESLRLYAQVNDIVNVYEFELRIQNARTLDEINAALDAGIAQIDADVFARQKANALAELEANENLYGAKCNETLRNRIQSAVAYRELQSALVAALNDVAYKSIAIARDRALSQLSEYEKQKGQTCDSAIRDKLENVASIDMVDGILAEAMKNVDDKSEEVANAKSTAIGNLKAYFEGRGIKYDDLYAIEIELATSVGEVRLALSRAIANVPAANKSNGGLIAGIVISALLALAGIIGVTLLLIERKKLLAKAKSTPEVEIIDNANAYAYDKNSDNGSVLYGHVDDNTENNDGNMY